jgi:hypothetical protein
VRAARLQIHRRDGSRLSECISNIDYTGSRRQVLNGIVQHLRTKLTDASTPFIRKRGLLGLTCDVVVSFRCWLGLETQANRLRLNPRVGSATVERIDTQSRVLNGDAALYSVVIEPPEHQQLMRHDSRIQAFGCQHATIVADVYDRRI